jgi:hypothetical protein
MKQLVLQHGKHADVIIEDIADRDKEDHAKQTASQHHQEEPPPERFFPGQELAHPMIKPQCTFPGQESDDCRFSDGIEEVTVTEIPEFRWKR